MQPFNYYTFVHYQIYTNARRLSIPYAQIPLTFFILPRHFDSISFAVFLKFIGNEFWTVITTNVIWFDPVLYNLFKKMNYVLCYQFFLRIYMLVFWMVFFIDKALSMKCSNADKFHLQICRFLIHLRFR